MTDSERIAEIKRLVAEQATHWTYKDIVDEEIYADWIPETLVATMLGFTRALTRTLIELRGNDEDEVGVDRELVLYSALDSWWVGGRDGRGFYLVEPDSISRVQATLKARLPALCERLEVDRLLDKVVRHDRLPENRQSGAYDVPSAATALGISTTRVRQLIRAGMIDAQRGTNGEGDYWIEETEIQRRIARPTGRATWLLESPRSEAKSSPRTRPSPPMRAITERPLPELRGKIALVSPILSSCPSQPENGQAATKGRAFESRARDRQIAGASFCMTSGSL